MSSSSVGSFGDVARAVCFLTKNERECSELPVQMHQDFKSIKNEVT